MVQAKKQAKNMVIVRVELFGQARLATDKRWVELAVPSNPWVSNLTQALAKRFPQLVGKAIRDDRCGLLESYTFNLNGTDFLDGQDRLNLTANDTILLFSSQAGG